MNTFNIVSNPMQAGNPHVSLCCILKIFATVVALVALVVMVAVGIY